MSGRTVSAAEIERLRSQQYVDANPRSPRPTTGTPASSQYENAVGALSVAL